MGGSTRPNDTVPPKGQEDTCPWRLTAVLPTVEGLTAGAPLSVLLEGIDQPRVALAAQSGARLGTLAGIPGLQRLIECLRDGVTYSASVDKVDGSAAFCVITRQPA